MISLEEAVANNVVWSAALALLAWVVGRTFRRHPRLAHALWLLVLLKLLTPSLVSVAPGQTRSATPQASIELSKSIRPMKPVVLGQAASKPPPARPTFSEPSVSTVSAPAVRSDQPIEPTIEPLPWRAIVIGLWILGATAWCARLTLQAARLRGLFQEATAASLELHEQVDRLAKRLGLRRGLGVWMVSAKVPPMLWALVGRPRLLLPTELWKGLDPSQQETILVHELAHLKRRDHWVRRLELVVLGLYWWNPVAWWARKQLEKAEEECCDAWVVWALPETAEAYAEALVTTAVFLSGLPTRRPFGASGAGRVLPLRERLNMILREPTKGLMKRPASRGLVIVGGLCLLVLPAWGASQPPPAEPEKKAAEAPSTAPTPKAEAQPPTSTKAELKEGELLNLQAGQDVPTIVPEIEVSQPILGEVSDSTEFSGHLEAAKTIEICAPRNGLIMKINYKQDGKVIEKGTVLFEIDSLDRQSGVPFVKAEFEKAEALHLNVEERVKTLEARLEQVQASDKEDVVDQLKVRMGWQKAQLKDTKINRDVAEKNLEKTIEASKIRAPIRGKVSLPEISEGAQVVAEGTTPTLLATIATTDPSLVDFDVDQETFMALNRMKREGKMKLAVEPGASILVAIKQDTNEFSRWGEIVSVDTRFNPLKGGSLHCRAAISNPDESLLPGLHARVQVFTSPPRKALLVAKSAIWYSNEPNQVHPKLMTVTDDGKVLTYSVNSHETYGGLREVVGAYLTFPVNEHSWIVTNPSLSPSLKTQAFKAKKVPMPQSSTVPFKAS